MNAFEKIFPAGDFALLALILGMPLVGAFVNGVFGKRLGKDAVRLMALSALGSRWAIAYARRNDLFDQPGERRSHAYPTPRGGGIGIVLACLPALLAPGIGGSFASGSLIATGLLLVAAIGWWDDHRPLPAWPRLLVHAIAAACLACAIHLQGAPGLAVAAAFALAVVLVNAWNFMDGIDGLIGGQMLVWGLHLVLLSNATQPTAAMGASLAGASAGFLLWNWAPARIFLGDVGSGSLGLLAVIGGIAAMMVSRWPLELVFLPLLPMFLDATVTLVRRHRKGARVWEAHREHFYQRLKPQQGVRYFVSGGAAKLRRGDIDPDPMITAKGYDQGYHFMVVEIAGDAFFFQAINDAGDTVDAGTLPHGTRH